MKKIMFNALILGLIVIVCGCSTIPRTNIINDNISAFFESRDYKKDEFKQFRVNDAMITPHFDGQFLYNGKEKSNEYYFVISAYSENELDCIQIHSYQIIITGELGNKNISEELNKTISFKKLKMDDKSGKNFYALDEHFKKYLNIPVDETSRIEVIIDISVKGSGKEERKTLKIQYKYEKTYHPNFPT